MSLTWRIGAEGARTATRVATPVTRPDRLLVEELIRLLREPRAPRLTLDLGEAAAALGVSPKFLTEHVRPELRLIRRGRKILVPTAELVRWLDENAAFTLAEEWRR